jgi:long-chain acyl-CoA synthetase
MVDYLLLARGCTISYAHSRDTLVADFGVVRPTVQCAVPRVYEKIYYGALGSPGLKGKLVRWARNAGRAWAIETLEGRAPSVHQRIAHALADKLVFSKIRARVGGRLRFFVSGSAPLDPEIARFFYAAGMPILEGYGLTETSPVTNVNTPEDLRIGTVGKPVAGTEIKLADDGEILVRGPQVMREYYKLPDETAKVIDAEGWFSTGDIGELDDDGYLKITDRKKDIIVFSGGDNVSPARVEGFLTLQREIQQAMVFGDKRPHLVALLVPDDEFAAQWCRDNGKPRDPDALREDADFRAALAQVVDRVNANLSSLEKVRRFAVLAEPFTVENGMMTPTMKIRRHKIKEAYGGIVDGLY